MRPQARSAGGTPPGPRRCRWCRTAPCVPRLHVEPGVDVGVGGRAAQRRLARCPTARWRTATGPGASPWRGTVRELPGTASARSPVRAVAQAHRVGVADRARPAAFFICLSIGKPLARSWRVLRSPARAGSTRRGAGRRSRTSPRRTTLDGGRVIQHRLERIAMSPDHSLSKSMNSCAMARALAAAVGVRGVMRARCRRRTCPSFQAMS